MYNKKDSSIETINVFTLWQYKMPYTWSEFDTFVYLLNWTIVNKVDPEFFIKKVSYKILNGQNICSQNLDYFSSIFGKHGDDIFLDLHLLITSYKLDWKYFNICNVDLSKRIKNLVVKFLKDLIEIDHDQNFIVWKDSHYKVFEILDEKCCGMLWCLMRKNQRLYYRPLEMAMNRSSIIVKKRNGLYEFV